MASLISWLGNTAKGVENVVGGVVNAGVKDVQGAAKTVGNVVNTGVKDVQGAAGAVQHTAAAAPQQIANTLAAVPNVRLGGLEQFYSAMHGGAPSKPITLGGVSHHIPILAQAEANTANGSKAPSVPTFLKQSFQTGIHYAPYVAPEMGIVKAGEGANLATQVGAKIVNNFVPGALTGAAATAVQNPKNLPNIATQALQYGAGNAAGAVGGLIGGKVIKAVSTDATAGFPTLDNESGKISLPGKEPIPPKVPTPSVKPSEVAGTTPPVKPVTTTPTAPKVAQTTPGAPVSPVTTTGVRAGTARINKATGTDLQPSAYTTRPQAVLKANSEKAATANLDQFTGKVQTALSQTPGRLTDQQLSDAYTAAERHADAGN